ncbi:MAG: hypothetical protein ACAI25_15955 [Planctomycetota bacterium]
MTKRRALLLGGLFSALAIGLLLSTDDRNRPAKRTGGPDPSRPKGPVLRPDDPPAAPSSGQAATPTSAQAAAPASGSVAARPEAATPLSEAELRAKIKAGEPGYEVLASRLPAETDRVTPVWREGDEWIVETYYRQMQAADQTWTGPAVFRFRVEREVSFRDRPCFEIVVTNTDDAAADPSVFYVTRDGRLAGQQTTVVQQGKKRVVTDVPEDESSREPSVIRAQYTLAPFTLPPFGAEAKVAVAGLAKELPARKNDRASRAHQPRADELVGSGGDYLDVEFEDPTDRTSVKQRWCREDMRWPVVSRTATTVSYRRKS